VRGAPKAEVSRALRLLEALDAQQNFEPFGLAEASDQAYRAAEATALNSCGIMAATPPRAIRAGFGR
jgi:hypothetical protein